MLWINGQRNPHKCGPRFAAVIPSTQRPHSVPRDQNSGELMKHSSEQGQGKHMITLMSKPRCARSPEVPFSTLTWTGFDLRRTATTLAKELNGILPYTASTH